MARLKSAPSLAPSLWLYWYFVVLGDPDLREIDSGSLEACLGDG